MSDIIEMDHLKWVNYVIYVKLHTLASISA